MLEYNSIGKITKEEIIRQIISQVQIAYTLQSHVLAESIDTTSVLIDAFNKLEMNNYEGSKPVISVCLSDLYIVFLIASF